MYTYTAKMKQLMRPYEGVKAKIRKVNLTQIHDTVAEPHEMEVK
jgi:hypothetical protein